MFNLKQAIAEWRKQMIAAGIKSPTPLDELEIHLREEIEQQMKSGLNGQQAFENSVQQIGQPGSLKGEFKKIERTFMKQTVKISAGIIGILVGVSLMVPGFIQLRDKLAVADDNLIWFLLGWALVGGSLLLSAANPIQQLIHPKLFKGEFEKVKMTPLKQTLKIGAGMAVLLAGMSLLLPAAAQAGHKGLVEFTGFCYAIFGITLLLTGAVVAFCPYKKRRA